MAKKILIADDEMDILRTVSFRLSKKGYEIIEAKDGAEAKLKITEKKPDLVILDYRMPHFTGLEVCLWLKNQAELAQIPVLIMTASTQALTDENLNTVKADGYITKPFETNDLVNTVNRYLGG